MALRPDLAREAIARDVGAPLGLEAEEAAAAIVHLACEHMVRAIEEITLVQGIDPRSAVMVAGGGGGGLYSSAIARRLGCKLVVVPEVSAALSATGTILSDLQADFSRTFATSSDDFDADGVNRVLDALRDRCAEFAGGGGAEVRLSVEARYPQQVWEIEVPLADEKIVGEADVERLRQDFHGVHEQIFAITDPESAVEFVQWRARVRVDLGGVERLPRLQHEAARPSGEREVRFPGFGPATAAVHELAALEPGATVEGPAIAESEFATVVVEPGGTATMTPAGSLLLHV